MARVLVCGGRDFNDPSFVFRHLSGAHERESIDLLIEGGATGVDRFARSWAETRGIPVETFRADWQTYGKAAGPLRNQTMLRIGKPDLVLAFPGGRGTANMVKQARESGVRVLEPKT